MKSLQESIETSKATHKKFGPCTILYPVQGLSGWYKIKVESLPNYVNEAWHNDNTMCVHESELRFD